MYIHIIDGQPKAYTTGALLRDHPNVSFPREITDDIFKQYQVYKVKQSPAPQADSKTHRQTQSVELIDSEWAQVWDTAELPLGRASDNVRAHRDHLLANTDWTALVDGTLSTEMATYRQALRDVPEQEGFPYAVTWPSKP
jgi:hypothetical protein